MRKSLLLSCIVVAMGLTACAHHPKSSQAGADHALPDTNAMNSAQSYGVQSGGAYHTDADTGRIINPLKAPSNQTYYFDYDSNNVHVSDDQALDIQANYLASHPSARIRLEGNTDNRGSREYNIGLGWRRAQAVQQYLVQRGVRTEQIQMVSYGKEHPAAMGDTPRAWALNRRVNLIYKVD